MVTHRAARCTVFVVEMAKLYVVFQAPAWLVGYAEFPQSGLVGSILVLCVAIALVVVI